MKRLVVVLRLTESCNLSCGFCAYDRTLERPRQAADRARTLAFGKMLAAHARSAERRVLVSFLGGEPLLFAGLAELESALVELGLELGVTTNGTSLSSAGVRGRLLERYADVTVSIDGLGSLHDELRGWPGGFDSLKRHVSLLADARRALGRGPALRVNTVLMRDNVDAFGELCAELAGWGIDEITFNQLGGRDRPQFFAEHHLEQAHVERLGRALPELRESLQARGVSLRGGQAYLDRFAASAAGRKLPVFDCAPGDDFWFVDEAGAISPCSFSGSHAASFAELAPRTLAELPTRFREQQKLRRLEVCNDCPSTQVFAKYAE